MKIRPASTRGVMKKSWIQSLRTFSNNDYWNPKYMRFGHLEVINDDTLEPGAMVPNHEHKNMEIFGYVVQGPCHHVDNLGNNCVVESGGIQRMSAGSGIWHTEGNTSDHPIRYLQLWIKPAIADTVPEHTSIQFTREQKLNTFLDITSYIPIKQTARLLAGIFTEPYTRPLNKFRKHYIYIVTGSCTLNGIDVVQGDGLECVGYENIEIQNPQECEIILFDLL